MRTRALVGLPFAAFVGLFLLYPTAVVLWRAITPGGTPGTAALERAISDPYQATFINSIKLSAASALIGAIVGLALGLAIQGLTRPRWVKPVFESWAAVASQLGGVPLAFAFVAAIGTQGILTKMLRETTGFSLIDHHLGPTGFWGLVVVYLYFQIPLMVLVTIPAIDGLKPAWREAAQNLGSTSFGYWRRVGIPVLAPSILGGMLLLFANAFSAYATAYVLSTGTSNLVSVQIRFFLQGNTITGKGQLGYALASWMIIIMIVCMGGYLMLRHRAERWRRT